MKKHKIIFLLFLIFPVTSSHGSTLKIMDSSQIEANLPGNTLINERTNELYTILPDGNLIYINGKKEEKSAGKWFVKKSKESDWYTNGSNSKYYDVICTPIGKTLLARIFHKTNRKPVNNLI